MSQNDDNKYMADNITHDTEFRPGFRPDWNDYWQTDCYDDAGNRVTLSNNVVKRGGRLKLGFNVQTRYEDADKIIKSVVAEVNDAVIPGKLSRFVLKSYPQQYVGALKIPLPLGTWKSTEFVSFDITVTHYAKDDANTPQTFTMPFAFSANPREIRCLANEEDPPTPNHDE